MNAGDPHRFSHDHDAAVRGGARGKIFGLASIDKWNLAFCWISAFVLFLILLQFTPRVANTSYLPDGKNQLWQTSYLPLSVTTKASGATVHTSLLLGSPHPSLLLVAASSCPTQISIDGIPVPPSAITCSKSGGILALSHFLHRGSNDFSAEIAASHGRVTFTITSAPADPLQLILFLLLFATLLGGVLLSIRPSIKRGNIPTLLLIFGGGTMLRFLYVLSTTYNVRSYDWVGHVEYIRYILQNLAVPPPTGGWQFYHPPLYYTLAALWGSLGWMMGKDPARLILNAQALSLLLSIATLAIGCKIGSLLFPKKEERLSLVLFCSLIAVFPAIVYHASRVSNDVLLLFLSFLAFAFLLRWWQKGNVRDWYLASLAVGLGVLTKNNALPLIGILWGCALLRKDIMPRRRAELMGTSFLILVVVSGWLFLVRPPIHDATLVGNYLNGKLRLSNDIANLVTFNPWQILTHVYNNTWVDSARRQFFWEFFFRSAFFGEFSMGLMPLAVTLLLSGLLLIPFVVYAFFSSLLTRQRDAIPLALTTVVLLASIFYLRIMSPYSPSQDFRYVPLLVVTGGAYVLYAAAVLPRWLRMFVLSCFIMLLFCSLTLLTALSLK